LMRMEAFPDRTIEVSTAGVPFTDVANSISVVSDCNSPENPISLAMPQPPLDNASFQVSHGIVKRQIFP